MSVIWMPTTGPLFIDHLSMTLDIPKHEQSIVIENFKNILAETLGGAMYSTKSYSYNKKMYFEGSGQILFQCHPKTQGINFFRTEYNPSNVASEEVAMIANLILPGGYPDLINYSRITRADITTDVKNLKIEDTLFHYPGLSISYNYLKSGAIQSAYIGSKGSVNQFKFYDKVQEIKSKNTYKPKHYQLPVPKHPTIRIEWEYRPKTICTFKNINQLCEPIYKKLWCGMYSHLPIHPKNDIESLVNMVVKLSRYEGLQQALYSIAKHRRGDVLKFMKNNSYTGWWKPESLWETFPQAIEPIVNPKPNEWAINS